MNIFWPSDLDLHLWFWPRYPSTWPPCKNSSLYVCPFGWDSETDTHTHTHRRCQNYYTQHIRDVGCNKCPLSVLVSKLLMDVRAVFCWRETVLSKNTWYSRVVWLKMFTHPSTQGNVSNSPCIQCSGLSATFEVGGTSARVGGKIDYFWAHLRQCMVGSYASLCVCLSVCDWTKNHWTIIHISKSIASRAFKFGQNIDGDNP